MANEPEYERVDVYVQAYKKYFGLIDHYFMVVRNREYHPGFYRNCVKPVSTSTARAHRCGELRLCSDCVDLIVHNFNESEDRRLLQRMFPIINCETLCLGLSLQSFALLVLPTIIAYCIFAKKINYFVIALMIAFAMIYLLLTSKYRFSRFSQASCRHVVASAAARQQEDE